MTGDWPLVLFAIAALISGLLLNVMFAGRMLAGAERASFLSGYAAGRSASEGVTPEAAYEAWVERGKP